MNPVILFAGGGTLGPVTPLLAIYEELLERRPGWAMHWVGTARGPEKELLGDRLPYHSVPTVKLRRYLSWQNVTDLARLPLVWSAADRLVRQLRPTVIVSAGGFVAVPISRRGHAHGAKVLIHQQDIRPGLTNKLIAPVADQITVAFAASIGAFPSAKTTWVGNPVRRSFLAASAERARQTFQLRPDWPVVLFMGGGTGAEAINRLVREIRPLLEPRAVMFHLTGPARGYPDETTKTYVSRSLITERMGDIMAAADIVVCRAGLGTLAELSALGKPTIVIPMPQTHQEDNADSLGYTQAAKVCDQRTTTAASLMTDIQDLLDHPDRRVAMAQRLQAWNKPGAAGAITSMVEHLAT